MNKQRRKEIKRALILLTEAQEILENCQSEEKEYRDYIPDNLSDSERYTKADEAVDALSDVVSFIGDAVSSCEAAIE